MLLLHKDKIDDLVGGKSLLHVAARCRALTTIKQLISLGADVNRSSGAEEKCMTVLHFAAEGGHAEALKLLIKHGAMVDSRSTSLSTPFYRAARSGSLEALKTLYDAGADINAKTWDHWTPLFESISHGRRRIASQLLQWGADLTAVTLQGESTLMMLRRNRNEQILTENGFDALVKGLAKQYILVLPIDKDTRPGTKREKDQRFPHDVSPTSSFFPVPLFRQALTSI
jgi:ankyrin repeat protein